MPASRAIHIPAALRDRVFIAEDLAGVAAIRADTSLPGFKSSVQPVLATAKVRYVGELVAMCVAPTRAEAEDLASEIEVDFDPLPAVTDMLAARKPGTPLVHEHWGDNLYLTTSTDVNFEAVKAKAAVSVTRELRTARQAMSPIEGRGVVAQWQSRLGQLVVTTSTQQPHIVRSGLAGVPRHRRRPDPRRLARCRRRLRLQGHPAARGGGAGLGDAQDRRPAALDRGSPRRPHRQRQLPRASLHPHRLCRCRRPAAGARLRGDRRFRRLFGLSRSRRAWKAARSARSCRASTISRTTAAASIRWRPTSRRSCPIAASPAPACASRWR